ncbi:MAG TPA: HAD family hydrolase [Chitinophagaceae bacterium]|jgi:putative hydrolase of the HAD superfamily
MNTYKHYSFDLWMTLIRSNPSFKQERARFFFQNFNPKHKSLEEVSVIFRQVDALCNSINEKTGDNISSEEMHLMVISALDDHSCAFGAIDLRALYGEMEAIVFKHLPLVYSDETPLVLNRLQEAGNSTFSLLSNTAFIKGSTLREILKKIGLDGFFHFQLYSDETGMSKPNKQFFQLMVDNTAAVNTGIHPTEIIHVGDNEKADIEGARTVGIRSLLINSNNKSILSLLN